jgi:hypothetical protein
MAKKKMRKLVLVSLCVWIIGLLPSHAAAKGWRGIVPLHSTRADVEAILGKPEDPKREHSLIYNTAKEIALIDYSGGGSCGLGGWRVPAGTVTSIMVSPKGELKLSDLHINESKYRKVHDPETPAERFLYIDDTEGETIDVFQGRVVTITYSPSAEDEHLRCPAPEASTQISNHPIDTYHYISFKYEKQRLDNLAIHLQQKPEITGYIVVYSGLDKSLSESLRRARRAKTYLVTVRGIAGNRIAVIDGGRRDKFTIELYIVPKGAPANPNRGQAWDLRFGGGT